MDESLTKAVENYFGYAKLRLKGVTYTRSELALLALEHRTCRKLSKVLGYTPQGIIKHSFFKSLDNSQQAIGNKVAKAIGFRWCSKCCKYKALSDFTKAHDRSSKVGAYCYSCRKIINKDRKPYLDSYYTQNKQEFVARNAAYRAARLQRTPAWANLKEIKHIYKKCPEGHHVDHVIPLQGELVSGLHVETNLQYLPAEENLRKSNSYKV